MTKRDDETIKALFLGVALGFILHVNNAPRAGAPHPTPTQQWTSLFGGVFAITNLLTLRGYCRRL